MPVALDRNRADRVAAVEGWVAGPYGTDLGHRLVEPGVTAFIGRAGREVVVLSSADPYSDGQAAVGENIEGRQLLGNHRRRVERRDDQIHEHAHPLGERRRRGEGDQHLLIAKRDPLAATDGRVRACVDTRRPLEVGGPCVPGRHRWQRHADFHSRST